LSFRFATREIRKKEKDSLPTHKHTHRTPVFDWFCDHDQKSRGLLFFSWGIHLSIEDEEEEEEERAKHDFLSFLDRFAKHKQQWGAELSKAGVDDRREENRWGKSVWLGRCIQRASSSSPKPQNPETPCLME
jgi:hypothetical protein